jgi:hypothetical protein
MGRFETLMYDNRNWKGAIALVASMLIGLAVGFKGFDELPDLQHDRRAASVALYKARRILDRQFPSTLAHDRARDQVKVCEERVAAANYGIMLSNVTFGFGMTILGVAVVLYLRRSQGLSVHITEMYSRETPVLRPAPRKMAA